MAPTSHSFRIGGGQGRSLNRDLDQPLHARQLLHDGGGSALSDIRYFVQRFCGCDVMLNKYSSPCDISGMSARCLLAFYMLLGNDRLVVIDAKINGDED